MIMANRSKLWHLENFNLFKGMSQSEMDKLMEKTSMKSIQKDQFIYFPEDPSRSIFFLKEGRVKIGAYSEEGKEIIKMIVVPGRLVNIIIKG